METAIICVYTINDIIMQESLDQCPMPINADQNDGIDPKLSIPLKVDQCWSMPIDR